jgi:hypothetical protein
MSRILLLPQAAAEYVGLTGSSALAAVQSASRQVVGFASEHALALAGAAVVLVLLLGLRRGRR